MLNKMQVYEHNTVLTTTLGDVHPYTQMSYSTWTGNRSTANLEKSNDFH